MKLNELKSSLKSTNSININKIIKFYWNARRK